MINRIDLDDSQAVAPTVSKAQDVYDDEYYDDEPVDPSSIDSIPAHLINTKRWSEEQLEKARQELFDNGSEFLPTQRDEIVGIDAVLDEIDDLIHWLRNAKTYQRYNARLEPGVIFEGSPGTGKTLVSRYIATASGALFINVRDWPHNHSIFKDSDIKALFKKARQTYRKIQRPIVLFWDEFETNATDRANASNDVGAAVSQLTAELDGVHGKNEGILLIGCTNYMYGIDAALKRAGRMGLQQEFNPPDRQGKRVLLGHYLGKYRTRNPVDVDTLSYLFDSQATAADIEEACMEAWRFAVRRTIIENGKNGRKRPYLTQEDLIPVFVKRLVGPPSCITMTMEDRTRIAVHETGHALAALIWGIPLRIITVQPGDKALGKVMTAEVNEHIGSVSEMVAQMRVAIGSIVAEQEAGIPAALGSTGDVEMLNEIAGRLVENLYAGSRSKLFSVGGINDVRSSVTSTTVSQQAIIDADEDVKALLDDTFADAREAMAAIGKDRLWKIAHEVNERVTLTGQEFRDLVDSQIGDPVQYRPADRLPLALTY